MANQDTLLLRAKMIGAMIRMARISSGKTLQETADLIGTTSSIMSSYEHGRKPISLPELELLAYTFDIPLRQFWTPASAMENERETYNPELILPLRNRMIGAMLRAHRQEAGITIREMAETLNIPSSRITSYERGERPIPVPELEAMAREVGHSIEEYFDTVGPIAKWDETQQAIEAILELPADLRQFLCKPINAPYIRLAKHLSEMSVEKLRMVAEGLLDITL